MTPNTTTLSLALRHAALPALICLICLLAGCGNITQLHVADNSTAIVSARAVHRFGGGPGGGGLELEVSAVKARGEQQLATLEVASVGNQSISGPALLKHRARVQTIQLVYNHLLFAGRPAELEWFVGATWVKTNWESISANPADPRLARNSSWSGAAGGALGRLRLADALALELRYSGALAVRSADDAGERSSTELALAFRPAPGLRLRAGVAEIRAVTRPELLSTELSVRARGPFFNLGLDF